MPARNRGPSGQLLTEFEDQICEDKSDAMMAEQMHYVQHDQKPNVCKCLG